MGKAKGCLTVFVVLLAVGFIGSTLGERSSSSEETESHAESVAEITDSSIEKAKGVTGIESSKNKPEIEYFSYKLDGDIVKLDSYIGSGNLVELQPSYEIEGKSYKTDLSEFRISHSANTVIINEGITEVDTAIFNSTGVQKVFFPKSMTNVYDYTLSYLHPANDGDTIKIYYAGTQDEWQNIFSEYTRTKVEDAEFGEELGRALADKANEMIGSSYDSSLFEYFFSASPDDLR